MNITLSNLCADMESTLDQVDPETGELPEGFERIRGLVEHKAESVAAYILNSEAAADLIDKRAKELAGQAKAIRKRLDWIKRYLLENMNRCGMTEIRASDGSFTVKRYPLRDKSVEVFDFDLLPVSCVIEKIETSPNKREIARMIDGGEVVPGARFVFKDRVEIR